MRNYYVIRTRADVDDFVKKSKVAIGWSDIDFTKYIDDQDKLLEEIQNHYYSGDNVSHTVRGKKLGEIKRFIRDDGAIKVSRAMKSLCNKIQTYINDCTLEDKSPSIKEIAEHFGIDEQEVVFAMDSNKYPVSLFEKFDDDNNQCVLDKLPSGENNDDLIDKILLKDYINALPERERKVIILRYYRDKTQSEIAQMLGVSQVQISRIESKVISALKQALA